MPLRAPIRGPLGSSKQSKARTRTVRMDKGVVVDIGNNIEGFIPISQLDPDGKNVASPTDLVCETMNLEMKMMEVDPIHRRIVLGVSSIPEEQSPRPAEPSKVERMDALEDPAAPPPDACEVPNGEQEQEAKLETPHRSVGAAFCSWDLLHSTERVPLCLLGPCTNAPIEQSSRHTLPGAPCANTGQQSSLFP